MPSSYSPRLRLELQATGENRATWGTKANNDFNLIEFAIAGATTIAMSDANQTLTTANGTTDEARSAILIFTGALTANRTITIPTVSKTYVIQNATTGGFDLNITTSAIGAVVAVVPNASTQLVFTDGTDSYISGLLANTVETKSVYATKAGNYTAVATDRNANHRYTATATVSLTAAATLGSGWFYTVIADGGILTIDPNGAETIDGAATLTVSNGYSVTIYCDGAGFRTNFGAARRANAVGDVKWVAGSTIPFGTVKLNGASLSRTTYGALWTFAQASGMLASSAGDKTTNPGKWGLGDGSTTFELPDVRGTFMRSWDDGRGVDSGRAMGTAQGSQNLTHSHGGVTQTSGPWSLSVTAYSSNESSLETQYGGTPYAQSKPKSTVTMGTGSAPAHSHTINADGGAEARPTNVAMMPVVYY